MTAASQLRTWQGGFATITRQGSDFVGLRARAGNFR
jgi:hypothetical protein